VSSKSIDHLELPKMNTFTTLHHLHHLLQQQQLTLSVAESISCGHLQVQLGSVSGASAQFLGGITAYSLASKTRLLGVDANSVKAVNGVSQAIAVAMAHGVCQLFGSDLGLATTGYAEAYPAQKVSQPYAFFALVLHQQALTTTLASGRIDGDGLGRVAMQTLVADTALQALINSLETNCRDTV
jgi:nicotinamide-nucleotide amidase